MSDPSGQAPDRFHPLRLHELRLQRPFVGHVARNRDRAGEVTGGVFQRRRGQVQLGRGAQGESALPRLAAVDCGPHLRHLLRIRRLEQEVGDPPEDLGR